MIWLGTVIKKGKDTYSNEKVRFQGMEKYRLNGAFNFFEWRLRVPSGYLMDPDSSLSTSCR